MQDNSQQYVINHPTGASGTFLELVLLSGLQGFDLDNVYISPEGNCHDIGFGKWQSGNNFSFLMSDKSKKFTVGTTHFTNRNDIEKFYSGSCVTLINCKPDDFLLVSAQKTFKADSNPESWTETAYNNLRGNDWPEYSLTNIRDSEIIANEMISLHNLNYVKEWVTATDPTEFDVVIDFATVIGLSDKRLVDVVNKNFFVDLNTQAVKFIEKYQHYNQTYYKKYIQ